MKKMIMALVLAVTLGLGVMSCLAMPTYAADDICSDENIDKALREAAGCDTNKTLLPVAANIIQVVLGLMGVLAVGIMIYGGISYTISAGDAAKVSKAKNIIQYSLIGLVVAMLAYAIVYFVSRAIWS